MLPTVFADVDNRMKIAQDEIFGPVACLIPFKDEADAIRIANDTQYGLSSYVWTENIGRAHRVAAAIEAGMCFVNSQNVRDLRQPFGGTKASGTGREGGTWSYEVFLEPKNIAVSLGTHHIPHWGRPEDRSRRRAALSRRQPSSAARPACLVARSWWARPRSARRRSRAPRPGRPGRRAGRAVHAGRHDRLRHPPGRHRARAPDRPARGRREQARRGHGHRRRRGRQVGRRTATRWSPWPTASASTTRC